MRRTRPVGAELDAVLSQSILELSPDELTASAALDALDGKRKLAQERLLDEVRRVEGTALRALREE